MEDMNQLKRLMLIVTEELVAGCRFCIEISSDPEETTPIQCIKFSGNTTPIHLNAATCLTCREFMKAERGSGPKDTDD